MAGAERLDSIIESDGIIWAWGTVYQPWAKNYDAEASIGYWGTPWAYVWLDQALNQRDYPVISAFNTLVASLILIANVIVDISYAWIDPRIRYR